MPKMTPDRDDSRGSLAGEGGPQDGPIGGDDRRQQQDQGGGATASDKGGQDAQRHPGGSSRESENLG